MRVYQVWVDDDEGRKFMRASFSETVDRAEDMAHLRRLVKDAQEQHGKENVRWIRTDVMTSLLSVVFRSPMSQIPPQ